MGKKSKKGKVVKSSDFGPPRKIAPSEMGQLLEAYKIVGARASIAEDFLNELVRVYQNDIRQARKERRKDVRKELVKASNLAVAAGKQVARSGIIGRETLRHSASDQLNAMFDLDWLNGIFPEQGLLQTLPSTGRLRPPLRSVPVRPINSNAREIVHSLIQSEGPKLIGAALSEIGAALNDALIASRQRGGRSRNLYRHFFIISLASLWEEKLGRDCRSLQGLTFVDFCDAIFSYVQWPTGGLKRAVDKAITEWRGR